VIEIGADLLALAGARHDADLVGARAERRRLALEVAQLAGMAGEQEAAAALVGRIEPLARDQLLEELERGASTFSQIFGAARADPKRQIVPVQPDRATDHAAVARAGAGAERSGIEDRDPDARARQLERRGQAAVAAADDRDVHPLRQRPVVGRLGRRVLPPERLGRGLAGERIGRRRHQCAGVSSASAGAAGWRPATS
jgi:hypothetical protein